MARRGRAACSTALLLCLVAGGGSRPAPAQELALPGVTYPALKRRAASVDGFVPAGWILEAQATGDLNRDGLADGAFVLRQNDPNNVIENPGLGETPFDTNPRILAVAFRDGASGDYVLAAENHTLIPRREDPVQADPFGQDNGGMSIERGALKVSLHLFMSAGGWNMFTATHTFQYRDGRFALIGYDRATINRASGKTNDVSVNFLTGRIEIATGTIESDRTKVARRTLPRRALPTLETMGDGLAFDPMP